MNYLNQNHKKIVIYFFLLPEVHLLDFAGPAHIFYEAQQFGANYLTKYISINDNVNSALSLSIGNTERYETVNIKKDDILVIPGVSDRILQSSEFLQNKIEIFKWLSTINNLGVKISGICTGTNILAEAGLLNHKECTTHWKLAEGLKSKFPSIKLIENVVYVVDDNIYTCSGATGGIDWALQIIEEESGPILASKIAKEIILFVRRKSNNNQESVYVQYRTHFRKEIHIVQDWISNNLEVRVKLEDLAELANMSTRNFSRIFKNATGITPNQYTTKLRSERAKILLSNPELSLSQIAERCGYCSERQLRRILNLNTRIPSDLIN